MDSKSGKTERKNPCCSVVTGADEVRVMKPTAAAGDDHGGETVTARLVCLLSSVRVKNELTSV